MKFLPFQFECHSNIPNAGYKIDHTAQECMVIFRYPCLSPYTHWAEKDLQIPDDIFF